MTCCGRRVLCHLLQVTIQQVRSTDVVLEPPGTPGAFQRGHHCHSCAGLQRRSGHDFG
jgi:hypothetical protein